MTFSNFASSSKAIGHLKEKHLKFYNENKNLFEAKIGKQSAPKDKHPRVEVGIGIQSKLATNEKGVIEIPKYGKNSERFLIKNYTIT